VKGLLEGLEAEVVLVVDVMLPATRLVDAVQAFEATFPTVKLRLHVEALKPKDDLRCQPDLTVRSPFSEGQDMGVFSADGWRMADLGAKHALLLAVIPSKRDRKTPIPHDAEMYKWRHLVENCIQRLKEWRHIATRYDKTDTSFCAFIHLSAALRAIA
jgi:hypothetical protein